MLVPTWLQGTLWIGLAMGVIGGPHVYSVVAGGRSATSVAPPIAGEHIGFQNLPPVALDPNQAMADLLMLHAVHADSIDPEAEAEFASALRRIVTEKHGKPSILPGAAVGPANPPDQASAEVTAALRIAYEHFQRRAAILEAEKAYAEADTVRQTEKSLRDEVRRLDP